MANPLNKKLGTRPINGPSVAQRGRGGAAGRGRGVGGGGRGRGARTNTQVAGGVPKGGIYGGKAGEVAAGQNPEQYILGLLNRAGWGEQLGSGGQAFLQDPTGMITKIMQDYNTAADVNQNLNIADYMEGTYGAGYGGKRGKKVKLGSLTTAPHAEYAHWKSNKNPLSHMVQQFSTEGGNVNFGGNQDFQRWSQENFFPQVQAQFDAADSAAGGNLNFDDWYKSAGLLNKARRAYQIRPSSMRQISPVSSQGSWSWWA